MRCGMDGRGLMRELKGWTVCGSWMGRHRQLGLCPDDRCWARVCGERVGSRLGMGGGWLTEVVRARKDLTG
jgi:hypothetical protein